MSGWRSSWVWGIFSGLWAILSVLATGATIVLTAPFMGGRRAFHRWSGLWARGVAFVGGYDLDFDGWEGLPEAIRTGQQPAIFMATHESNLDPPTLCAAIRVPAVFISKKEVKWIPLVGWAAWVGGTIFIDRGNREKAKLSLQEAARQIREGKSVIVFPEGTRTRTGDMGEFKKGSFVLALDAGVPVVPVAAVGGFRIWPAGVLRLRPSRYTVRFGDPVDPKDFPHKDLLLREVHSRVVVLREAALAGEPAPVLAQPLVTSH